MSSVGQSALRARYRLKLGIFTVCVHVQACAHTCGCRGMREGEIEQVEQIIFIQVYNFNNIIGYASI